ncbi:hypothetical protein AXG93_2145s1710 [Marchantia polymorpha subsp. ruderalis]|uniref:Uncharacterized protein n=1 Tax=Marchantia polymorpha subsp. ruderalis TaxID=1480154 RepID=A0A176W077_MARPO|nr:hypothetical protein AXG93_2145s1710 [Marchantia polymorpha subsp. ruderalis]
MVTESMTPREEHSESSVPLLPILGEVGRGGGGGGAGAGMEAEPGRKKGARSGALTRVVWLGEDETDDDEDEEEDRAEFYKSVARSRRRERASMQETRSKS